MPVFIRRLILSFAIIISGIYSHQGFTAPPPPRQKHPKRLKHYSGTFTEFLEIKFSQANTMRR